MSAQLPRLGARTLLVTAMLAVVAVAQDRRVAGRVVAAVGGRPVVAAPVLVFGAIRRGEDRPLLAETVTAEDGSFGVDGVRPGPLLIQVSAAGFARAAATVQRQAADALRIVLEEGRSVTGRVIDARTGRAIGGARVTAPLFAESTDELGGFLLAGLPRAAERLAIAIVVPGYVPHHILVPDGVVDLRYEVKLEAGHVIGVRVTDDRGVAAEGVRIRARLITAVAYSELERADLSAVTDERGLAFVRGLPPGRPLCVEADGLVGTHSAVTVPVRTPVSGEPRVTVDLTVTPGRRASIEIVDGHGVPVVGAQLRVLPMIEPLLAFGGGSDRRFEKGAVRVGATDARGRAAWDFLPAGPITCEVRSVGRTTRMVVLHPTVDASAPVRVVLHTDPRPPRANFHWSPTVDAAIEQAGRDQLPVLVCMAMDNERANDWMATHHYHDIELVRVTREMPTILSNVFGAGGVTSAVPHGETDGRCSRYGGIPCASHQGTERWCVDELVGSGVAFQVPHHILMSPAGEVLLRREYFLSERDLMRIAVFGLRHVHPQRALALARVRLQRLRHRLVALDDKVSRRAVGDLIALVNAGDEHGTALLADLVPLGVSPAARAAVVRGLVPSAIRAFDSALRPLIEDPDPVVRRAVAARVAGATDGDALVSLLLEAILDPDSQVAASARNAVGVGVRGDQFVVIRPTEGSRWRLVAALLREQPALMVLGVKDVLASRVPLARNRVLRLLARRCEEDDVAYRLLMAEAMKDDLGALGALRALRAAKPRSRRALLDAVVDLQFGSASHLQREEAMRLAAWVGTTKSRELLVEGLDDWEPNVQIAAAFGRLSLLDRRCVPILLRWVEDPFRGPEIKARLRRLYDGWQPTDGQAWRRWFVAEGLIEPDQEDGAP